MTFASSAWSCSDQYLSPRKSQPQRILSFLLLPSQSLPQISRFLLSRFRPVPQKKSAQPPKNPIPGKKDENKKDEKEGKNSRSTILIPIPNPSLFPKRLSGPHQSPDQRINQTITKRFSNFLQSAADDVANGSERGFDFVARVVA